MTPEDAVSEFLGHLEAERRASPHTVAAYRRDLLSLVRFVEERDREHANDLKKRRGLEGFDLYTLRAWLGKLSRSHAASSVARKIAAVRTWMKWLRRRGVLAASPADELATPKVRRPLPTFLSVDAAAEVV